MDRYMDTVLEIYRVFMRRATPPADAARILRIIIALEEDLPHESDLSFTEVRQVFAAILKQERKTE
jgi:hypothetical protein